MGLQGKATFVHRLTEDNKCQGFRIVGDEPKFFLKVFSGSKSIDVEISEETYNQIRKLNNEQTRKHQSEFTKTD